MNYEKLADYLKALGHPTRLMIVHNLLEQEQCVTKIQELVKKQQANISQHLHILKNAGIVKCTPRGQKRCYSLVHPKEIKTILTTIVKLLDTH